MTSSFREGGGRVCLKIVIFDDVRSEKGQTGLEDGGGGGGLEMVSFG